MIAAVLIKDMQRVVKWDAMKDWHFIYSEKPLRFALKNKDKLGLNA